MFKQGIQEQKITPMMEQWLDAKKKHPDAILLFRMGDFYELFGDDAVIAAPILELALTSRDKDKSGTKMAGFPCHSADGYIVKLVEQGLKVAVCEQLEDPKNSRGIVKRGVVEVITPGTLIEEDHQGTQHNFLVSVAHEKGVWGLCALDIASASFIVTTSEQHEKIRDELSRLRPKEVVVVKTDESVVRELERLQNYFSTFRFRLEKKEFLYNNNFASAADKASTLLKNYVCELNGKFPEHIGIPVHYSIDQQLLMDEATRENLDILPKKKGQKQNLYSVMNYAKTAMAKRMLAKEICAPTTSLSAIMDRQTKVKELVTNRTLREKIREHLSGFYDINKLTALASSNKIGPRGLARIRDSLILLDLVKKDILDSSLERVKECIYSLPDLGALRQELELSLIENPPMLIKDGGIFKKGYDSSLDQLVDLALNGQDMLLKIENKERDFTGISSLKIKYTRVFGYYIEITKSNLDKVPDYYQRKQTIANGERYVTPELHELEIKLNSAKEQLLEHESILFERLRDLVQKSSHELIRVGQVISELDLVAGFAQGAEENNWVCPEIVSKEAQIIQIQAGRHPVVESLARKDGTLFVPNSLELGLSCRLALITGPNMAGKSTIMRQMALIQIMAQLGSFVPAGSAKLSITDQIFARVGASDDLSSGRSTFMVEMTETSYILQHATPYSLILLDEIGRGTSTYDGMSIAQAVAEYIHDTLKTRTLFATHYHELTELEGKLSYMKNFHVEVLENNDEVRFLYTIKQGPARESFGIQVAKLAGLPTDVVLRARDILVSLEKWQKAPKDTITNCKPEPKVGQAELFQEEKKSIDFSELERLAGLDINRMTPVQALVKLQSLQNSLRMKIKSF